MGRDQRPPFVGGLFFLFQSTLPAWGETYVEGTIYYKDQFQSTLPAWGETKIKLGAEKDE